MTHRELEMLLDELFEGSLEGEDLDRLQSELRASAAARAAYRESLHLDHSLRFRAKGVDLLKVVPMERVVERRQRRAMRQAVMSAAAVLVLGALVMAVIFTRPKTPTLSFTASPGSEVYMSHRVAADQIPNGRALEPGSRMVLSRGTVELEFASGVRAIVRGPAEMTLQREDLLDLERGAAWFDVPRKAVGFQVRTPDLVLTDLGTEFGLISERNFLDEVHVFTGKVQVLNRYGLKNQEIIHAGQARSAGPAGRWQETPLRRDPFLTKLPAGSPVPILLDDSAVFTSSPGNEMIRQKRYVFGSAEELIGFNPDTSDKLVVTLSHERGTISEVTYGGVRMSLAIWSGSAHSQQTSIYYLDSPGAAGDLVVTFSETPNGVGGSLLALSNTAPGGPAVIGAAAERTIRVDAKTAGCLLVASHAFNDYILLLKSATQPQLSLVFNGPTGSSMGGSGYLHVESSGPVTATFASKGNNPVTVAAVFAPIP